MIHQIDNIILQKHGVCRRWNERELSCCKNREIYKRLQNSHLSFQENKPKLEAKSKTMSHTQPLSQGVYATQNRDKSRLATIMKSLTVPQEN